MKISRLNGVIGALESERLAFATFCTGVREEALSLCDAGYDAVVAEMEHQPYDVGSLRDFLQYLLSRRQIVDSGTLSPAVTPLVRIPANGGERNQWLAKQVLDAGAYGVVWPHITTVEDASNAVMACRYPRLKGHPLYQPGGVRGDAPAFAARYWGLTRQEYYERADVWPLNPRGEILVILMIEDTRAIENLPNILREVPGIGVILVGEGDLSQELDCPQQYGHPRVVDALRQVLETCKAHDVPCGHPHVRADNIERIVSEGYRFLATAPVRSFPALEKARQLGVASQDIGDAGPSVDG